MDWLFPALLALLCPKNYCLTLALTTERQACRFQSPRRSGCPHLVQIAWSIWLSAASSPLRYSSAAQRPRQSYPTLPYLQSPSGAPPPLQSRPSITRCLVRSRAISSMPPTASSYYSPGSSLALLPCCPAPTSCRTTRIDARERRIVGQLGLCARERRRRSCRPTRIECSSTKTWRRGLRRIPMRTRLMTTASDSRELVRRLERRVRCQKLGQSDSRAFNFRPVAFTLKVADEND